MKDKRVFLVVPVFLLILVVYFWGEIPVNKDTLLGDDYRLFQNTPIWSLAKAVRGGDIKKMEKLVKRDGLDINYQEPRFGQTLLMMTIMNQQDKSFIKMLELGTDITVRSTYRNYTAVHYASEVLDKKKNSGRFVSKLLAYGANPNTIGGADSLSLKSPLLLASSLAYEFTDPLSIVLPLVEAGANVNFRNESNWTPLNKSVINGNYDVSLLLIKSGAEYREPIIVRINGDRVTLVELLRGDAVFLDSKRHKDKMKLVAFLQEKGIDYSRLPVPSSVIRKAKKMYPETWEEYLEKY